MENYDAFLDVTRKINKIANEYANLLNDGYGAVYSGPAVDCETQNIIFSVGPSTSGMARAVSLPLSLIEDCSNLEELAKQQKEKWAEDIRKNNCQTCGRPKW